VTVAGKILNFGGDFGPADAAFLLFDAPVGGEDGAVLEANGGGEAELETGEFIDAVLTFGGFFAEGFGVVEEAFGEEGPGGFGELDEGHDDALLAVAAVVEDKEFVVTQEEGGHGLAANAGGVVRSPSFAAVVREAEAVFLIDVVAEGDGPGGGDDVTGFVFGELVFPEAELTGGIAEDGFAGGPGEAIVIGDGDEDFFSETFLVAEESGGGEEAA